MVAIEPVQLRTYGMPKRIVLDCLDSSPLLSFSFPYYPFPYCPFPSFFLPFSSFYSFLLFLFQILRKGLLWFRHWAMNASSTKIIKTQPLPSESSLSGGELALFLHGSIAQNSGLGLQMAYLCSLGTSSCPLAGS